MVRELEHLSYEDILRELGWAKSRDKKALGRTYCSLSVFTEDLYKMGTRILAGPVVIGQGTLVLN